MDRRAEIRRGLNIGGIDIQYIRYPVHYHADDPVTAIGLYRNHDHHRDLGVLNRLQPEPQPQVNDRHNRAAQIHHSAHKGRCIWHLGHRHPAANLLHLENINSIFFASEVESQVLRAFGQGVALEIAPAQGG